MITLGLDLGTSGLKGVLIDSGDQTLASASVSIDTRVTQPGYSEQHPSDWLLAVEQVLGQLRLHPSFSAVAGIAVSGHMHGAVVLGADDQPLRPCILWNDVRADDEAQALDAIDEVVELTGNRVFAGFTAPKLRWMQRHEPELFAQAIRVVLPASYLNLYLCGEAVIDCSDAAGTGWFDVKGRRFVPSLLAHTGLELTHMPRVVEGNQVAGTLRPALAQRWGLAASVVVAGGAGDNAASACAMGVVSQGQGFVSLGTSGVVLAGRSDCTPRPQTAVHTFCHALPDRWYQMSVMLAATDSLNWLARILGREAPQLVKSLGESLRAPGTVQFYPYLSGERTPHNNPNLRGGFTGLSGTTGASDMVQAVLLGVACGLNDGRLALVEAGPIADELWALGGGAHSDYWLSMLATLFGCSIVRPQGAELGAALGAARLARAAAQGDNVGVFYSPRIGQRFEPIGPLRQAYLDSYAQFQEASRQSWLLSDR